MRAILFLAGVLLALAPLGDAAAQIAYGQCQDRARDRLQRGQATPSIGADRARGAYQADMQECVRLDAQERARDVRADDQRLDRQQVEQQRQEQQRLDQQRARQRDDRNRR